MCSVFLCLSLILFFPKNGGLHVIRLPLIKEIPYSLVEEFRQNAEFYRDLLTSYLEPPSKYNIQGKLDRNVDYYGQIVTKCSHKEVSKVMMDTSSSGFWTPLHNSFSLPYSNNYSMSAPVDCEDFEFDIDGTTPQSRTIMYTIFNQYFKISGLMGYLTVMVDNYRIPGVQLMTITERPSEYIRHTVSDGVFGLGFPSGSLEMSPPFFTILDRGIVDRTEFSIFVGNKNETGELVFGGRNELYYESDSLHFHNVTSINDWKIAIKSVAFGEHELCTSSCDALIDTGTALIAAPKKSLEFIHNAVNWIFTEQIAEVSCRNRDSLPLLKLTIDDQVITLNGYDYTIQIDGQCLVAIMESPINNLWILGNVFLSTVYSVFDVGQMKIGFAHLLYQSKQNQSSHYLRMQ